MFTSILFPNEQIYTDTVRPGRGIMHHSGSLEHILNGVFETLYVLIDFTQLETHDTFG